MIWSMAAGKRAEAAEDTDPEAAEVQLEVFRRMGQEGRSRAALEMSDDLRRMTEDGVRRRHPDYSDDEVRLAGIRILLGDELFFRAYPGARVAP